MRECENWSGGALPLNTTKQIHCILFQNCYEMYKYLSEEPRSKNRPGKVGVAGNNNHDNYNRLHRRRHQRNRQQQQLERIKREIQIRAVISDDLDLDIEDDDDDKDINGDDLENNSSVPAIAEEGELVPGGRCQGCAIQRKFYAVFQITHFNGHKRHSAFWLHSGTLCN